MGWGVGSRRGAPSEDAGLGRDAGLGTDVHSGDVVLGRMWILRGVLVLGDAGLGWTWISGEVLVSEGCWSGSNANLGRDKGLEGAALREGCLFGGCWFGIDAGLE